VGASLAVAALEAIAAVSLVVRPVRAEGKAVASVEH
jgi:hypothetical protein